MSDEDYYTIRGADLGDMPLRSRPRPFRAAALFTVAAIALTALVAPNLLDQKERRHAGFDAAEPFLDDRAVGSIRPAIDPLRTGPARPERATPSFLRRSDAPARPGTYVVRRSVLSEGSVCVIGSGGRRSGNC